MKKKLIIPICILFVALCGCSSETEEFCPDYFVPIAQEIWSSNDNINSVIEKWMNQSLDFSEVYADKVYTCEIDGKQYNFDLHNELSNAEEWYWSTAGIFSDAEEKYICLHDYNIMYENGIVQEPQLLLIEFSTNNPEEYQIYSYEAMSFR